VSFPVAAVIQRLQSLRDLRLVGTAADLATAMAQMPGNAPAAYVVGSRRGEKPVGASSGVQIQHIDCAIAVVLFVKHSGTAETGAAARTAMDALQAQVDALLVGWSPDAYVRFLGLHFVASKDEFYASPWLCSQVVYRSRYRQDTPT